MKKNAKRTKRSYAYKDYVSTYIVENLNYFNPELQLKYTQYAVKNKLIDLVIELKCFKFVATLVLEFEKIEMMIKQNIAFFILTQKLKQLLLRVTLMFCLNLSIVLLYQT